MNFTFEIATDKKIKEEAYRLRYEVFSLEKNIYLYADVNSGMYKDDLDDLEDTVLIVAFNDKREVIATSRVVPIRYTSSRDLAQSYNLDLLANKFGWSKEELLQTSVVLGRGVVAQTYRKQGVNSLMMDFVENYCLSQEIFLQILFVSVDNFPSLKLSLKRGYQVHDIDLQKPDGPRYVFHKKLSHIFACSNWGKEYLDILTKPFYMVKQEGYKACGLKSSADKKKMDILDIGCGLGTDTLELAQYVTDDSLIVGIDIDQHMIEYATQQASAHGVSNVIYSIQDSEKLSYRNKFDCVRTERVFQHLPSPENTLQKMVDAVKPDGKVVVIETDWSTLQSNVLTDADNKKIASFSTISLPSGNVAKRLAKLFQKAGLTQVREERVRVDIDYDTFFVLTRSWIFLKPAFFNDQDKERIINKFNKDKNIPNFASLEMVIVSGKKA
jgi:ubiquinone/menaquinone biosynthesis C-methylase UbiE/predicted GNAT family N-acyltransferase